MKDTNWRLEFKIQDLRSNAREIEQSYIDMKAQKNSLKEQLEKSKIEAASDSEGPSKKRGRQE
ncbi:hypothetical protein B0O99DRAFT_749092 [Bisporella sp. PMI_857]|nr:hypothetical protein B0O99DRAFT_749092 [Bisporella sp. PMI_857]